MKKMIKTTKQCVVCGEDRSEMIYMRGGSNICTKCIAMYFELIEEYIDKTNRSHAHSLEEEKNKRNKKN
jgi:hypothetical protein